MLRGLCNILFVIWVVLVVISCSPTFDSRTPNGQMYDYQTVLFLNKCAKLQEDLFARYDRSFLLKTKQLDSIRIQVAKEFKSSHNPIENDSIYLSLNQMIKLLFDVDKEDALRHSHEQTIGEIEKKIQQWRWLLKYVDDESFGYAYLDLILPKQKNDCEYMSHLMADVLNELGIVTFCEYTPLWQDKPRSHYWCATTDSLGRLQPFTPPENNLREDWESDLKFVGKVYRVEKNPKRCTPVHIVRKGEYLPEVFRSDKLSDQTKRYHKTSIVRIPLNRKTSNQLAYLCFYDNNDDKLSPVGWGRVRLLGRSVVFKHVPRQMILFPAIYDENQLYPISNPFIIEDCGRLRWIEPHGTVDMTLYRKYPEKRRLVKAAENLVGVTILGGDSKKGPFDTLGMIMQMPVPYVQDIVLMGNERSYQYYKIVTKDNVPLNIAEIQLLGSTCSHFRTVTPMELPSFSSDSIENSALSAYVSHLLPTGNSVGNAIDGDVLSYTGSSDLIFYFENPAIVKVIRYLPRNANNIIVKSNEYVLYYYDKGWVEFDDKIATLNCIRFCGVPDNTVYLLSNLSGGTEELPFYYVNGKQVFINSSAPHD